MPSADSHYAIVSRLSKIPVYRGGLLTKVVEYCRIHYLCSRSYGVIKVLQKYTGSEVKKRASSPKIIPLNNGLIHAFPDPGEVDLNPEWRGRIFEAAVGAALTSISDGSLYYWRAGKYELDYVLLLDRKVYAIEVKSGRRRNIHGLTTFLKNYPDSIPVIIDNDNVETLLCAMDVGGLFRTGEIF